MCREARAGAEGVAALFVCSSVKKWKEGEGKGRTSGLRTMQLLLRAVQTSGPEDMVMRGRMT